MPGAAEVLGAVAAAEAQAQQAHVEVTSARNEADRAREKARAAQKQLADMHRELSEARRRLATQEEEREFQLYTRQQDEERHLELMQRQDDRHLELSASVETLHTQLQEEARRAADTELHAQRLIATVALHQESLSQYHADAVKHHTDQHKLQAECEELRQRGDVAETKVRKLERALESCRAKLKQQAARIRGERQAHRQREADLQESISSALDRAVQLISLDGAPARRASKQQEAQAFATADRHSDDDGSVRHGYAGAAHVSGQTMQVTEAQATRPGASHGGTVIAELLFDRVASAHSRRVRERAAAREEELEAAMTELHAECRTQVDLLDQLRAALAQTQHELVQSCSLAQAMQERAELAERQVLDERELAASAQLENQQSWDKERADLEANHAARLRGVEEQRDTAISDCWRIQAQVGELKGRVMREDEGQTKLHQKLIQVEVAGGLCVDMLTSALFALQAEQRARAAASDCRSHRHPNAHVSASDSRSHRPPMSPPDATAPLIASRQGAAPRSSPGTSPLAALVEVRELRRQVRELEEQLASATTRTAHGDEALAETLRALAQERAALRLHLHDSQAAERSGGVGEEQDEGGKHEHLEQRRALAAAHTQLSHARERELQLRRDSAAAHAAARLVEERRAVAEEQRLEQQQCYEEERAGLEAELAWFRDAYESCSAALLTSEDAQAALQAQAQSAEADKWKAQVALHDVQVGLHESRQASALADKEAAMLRQQLSQAQDRMWLSVHALEAAQAEQSAALSRTLNRRQAYVTAAQMRWLQGRGRACFEAWSAWVTTERRGRVAVAKIRSRSRTTPLAAPYVCWAGWAAAMARQRRAAGRTAVRVRQTSKAASIVRWRSSVELGVRRRLAARRAAARWCRRALVWAVEVWRCLTSRLARWRRVLEAVGRERGQALRDGLRQALLAWRHHCHHRAWIRASLRKALLGIAFGSLVASFDAWRELMTAAAQLRRKRQVCERIVKHLSKHKAAAALRVWCENTWERLRQRRVMRRVVSRLLRRQLSLAFHRWASSQQAESEQRKFQILSSTQRQELDALEEDREKQDDKLRRYKLLAAATKQRNRQLLDELKASDETISTRVSAICSLGEALTRDLLRLLGLLLPHLLPLHSSHSLANLAALPPPPWRRSAVRVGEGAQALPTTNMQHGDAHRGGEPGSELRQEGAPAGPEINLEWQSDRDIRHVHVRAGLMPGVCWREEASRLGHKLQDLDTSAAESQVAGDIDSHAWSLSHTLGPQPPPRKTPSRRKDKPNNHKLPSTLTRQS